MRAQTGGRAVQAALRREQMLAAALELFCAQGFAATSTRKIADAAGVAEGLIFHQFGSKDGLLLELAARRHTFAGRVLSLLQHARDASARELLRTLAVGVADVSPQEGAFLGFLLAEAQVNASLRDHIQTATTVVLARFVQVLARRVTTGELRGDADLSAAAHGFFGGFLFFFSQHRDLGATAWRREATAFADAWAEQCWRGLATTASLSGHSTKRERTKR